VYDVFQFFLASKVVAQGLVPDLLDLKFRGPEKIGIACGILFYSGRRSGLFCSVGGVLQVRGQDRGGGGH